MIDAGTWFYLMAVALTLSTIVSAITAVREFRRGSRVFGALAMLTLVASVAALASPVRTFSEKPALPAGNHAG